MIMDGDAGTTFRQGRCDESTGGSLSSLCADQGRTAAVGEADSGDDTEAGVDQPVNKRFAENDL